MSMPFACSQSNDEAKVDELRQACQSELDRAGCNAIPSYENSDVGLTHYCSWEGWVPVSLDGEMCIFGKPSGTCVLESVSDPGCAGGRAYRTAGGSIELATDETCFPNTACDIDWESGEVYDGPPECACLVSPEYSAL